MMKINADVYVKDMPGTLVSALEPISMFEGNIVGVFHNREQVVSGRILVNITFNIEPKNLEKLRKEWNSRDVVVVKLGEDVEIISREYMFIGDIHGTIADGIVAAFQKYVKLDSIEIGYSSKISKKSHAAIISAKMQSDEGIADLEKYLTEECSKRDIVFIRGVEQ